MVELPQDLELQMLSACYLEMTGFGPYVSKLDFAGSSPENGAAYRVCCVIEGSFAF
jgi:hypothetical protein